MTKSEIWSSIAQLHSQGCRGFFLPKAEWELLAYGPVDWFMTYPGCDAAVVPLPDGGFAVIEKEFQIPEIKRGAFVDLRFMGCPILFFEDVHFS